MHGSHEIVSLSQGNMPRNRTIPTHTKNRQQTTKRMVLPNQTHPAELGNVFDIGGSLEDVVRTVPALRVLLLYSILLKRYVDTSG